MKFGKRCMVLVSLVGLLACSDAPEGDQAKIREEQQASNGTGQSYLADTTASKIRFTGHGVGKNHPGTFRLTSGNNRWAIYH